MPRNNSKMARDRRRERAKERQQPGYVTQDWRWGGPRQIPHRPVANRIQFMTAKTATIMEEAADAFKKNIKVFNQFTDLIPGRKTEIYNDTKEGYNG